MKLLSILLLTLVLAASATRATAAPIIHSVFFSLKHEAGSDAESKFIKLASELAKIPGVENFQVLRETSPKNDWKWGLSMRFADQAAYDSYNKHPQHVAFVKDVWLKQVADFQEIDYVVEK